MRVALITEIVSHYRLPVFNSFRKLGLELCVLYLRENVPERQWRVYKEEINHEYQILPGHHLSTGPSRNAYLSPTVGKVLSAVDPDVIVCGGYNHTAAIQALYFARFRRKPFILWSESTVRDHRPGRLIYELYKRWIVQRSDRFVAAGSAAREYLIGLGAATDRIWIAPDAVNNEWYFGSPQPRSYASSELPNLLYVGRLTRGKGLKILLMAACELERMFAFKLTIAGDGEERSELEKYASTRLSNVRFTGFVQPRELSNVYESADAFVFPSLSDPWGLVLNEAMAAGLPILSSTAPGAVDDLLIEGHNGFCFHPNDPSDTAGVLERFMRLSLGVWGKMGKNSRALIEYFSPERCARGFAESIFGEKNRVREEYESFRATLQRVVEA